MATLNLGILAHVDAGKTTLTERLLYAAGVIDEIGSVDAGSTKRLGVTPIAMGRTAEIGARTAGFVAYDETDPGFRAELVEVLTRHDDALLAAYVVDEAAVAYRRLRTALAAQIRRASVCPVYFGSAVSGSGVEALIAGIAELLPASDGDADAPASGTVFKIDRGPAGEKIAYVRMFAGAVRTRDRVCLGSDEKAKVTGIRVFRDGTDVQSDAIAAGQIGKLWGLGAVQVGDPIGTPRDGTPGEDGTDATHRHFAPPTLETVVAPARERDNGALHGALAQLAEQDPLINMRHDDLRRETSVSLYGEVQKEIIQATLAHEYGIDVTFRDTTTICVERPVGTGADVELLDDEANPFKATVGLRIEPGPVGSGVQFRPEVELGSMPYSFFRAVEETVRATLRQGLHGWEVTDCIVTMTHSGYVPPPPTGWSVYSSSAGDFRALTPLVLMSALKQAGTRVYEPIHRFEFDVSVDTVAEVLTTPRRLHAVPLRQTRRGRSYVVEGEVSSARVHELSRVLPGLTHGDGGLETTFGHYQRVSGPIPTRPRTDHNPLERGEYLLHLARRF